MLAILVFNITLIVAQQDSVILSQKVNQVSLDPFSNLYVLTEDNEFVKYNEKGEVLESHTDLELSNLSEISSDHPFKCMIYYPEYDLIRVFGNRLQLIAELNLTQYVFGEITAVAPSTGYQSFWIFDATAQKLIRVNQQYEIEIESDELSNYTQTPFFPTIIKEREGWVYAYDPDNGLFIFDNFGTFSTQIKIEGVHTFSVFDQKIYVSKDEGLFEVDPVLKTVLPLNIEIEGQVMELSFRKMVIQNENALSLVKF